MVNRIGSGMKQFMIPIWRDKYKYITWFSLLFLAWHLSDKGAFWGYVSIAVLLVILIYLNRESDSSGLLVKKMFYNEPIQRNFSDLLFSSLLIGIIFPRFFCNGLSNEFKFIQGISIKIYHFVLNNRIYNFIHKYVPLVDVERPSNNVHLSFMAWDLIAILMSIILTKLYFKDIFEKINPQLTSGNSSNNVAASKDIGRKARCTFYAQGLLLLAIGTLLIQQYRIMLILLCAVGSIFVCIDHWLLKVSNQLDTKTKVQLRRQTIQSLYYGNVPATIGLFIMLFFEISSKGNQEIAGFIAGGSAMHMVFGNIVVAIGLGKSSS